jgi:16S rRNA (guanine527-N7)-methyltransferase
LVESRKLRVDFLKRAATLLDVQDRVEILCSRVETLQAKAFDVISARAFAPLDKLLLLGAKFSTDQTRWILPKGRNAKTELEAAESLWQGEFRLEPSVTDPDASIIVAERVRRRLKERSGR